MAGSSTWRRARRAWVSALSRLTPRASPRRARYGCRSADPKGSNASMQNILIIAPEHDGKLGSVICALQHAGHDVGQSSLSGSKSVGNLCGMFDGRPPDILLADLSDATDCLAIRHTVRLLQHAWGEDMPRPVCIALLRAEHF